MIFLKYRKINKKKKIGLITSRGGHLFQVYQLKNWWQHYDRFWVTGKGKDVEYLLKKEKVYFAYFPESRSLVNAFKNLILAFRILWKEKPDLLFSTGAGVAAPFFLVGKILGCKLIFMEPYDFIKYPSLTGKLVAPLVDKLLVQHLLQKNFYKNSEYWGTVL